MFAPHGPAVSAAVCCTYTEVRVLNIQRGAHACEVSEVLLVQQDVDGDSALVGRLHEVAEQVHVREHVHHHGDHLQESQTLAQSV